MRYTKNSRIQERRDKRFRFSIRKFNVGVASVAVAAFWMVSGGTVAANELGVTEGATVTTTAEPTTASDAATIINTDANLEQETDKAQPKAEAETPLITEVTEAVELTEVAPGIEVPVTEAPAPATQEAPRVPVAPTRTAATTYRIQYVNEETGALEKQENYSATEQTTADAHTFHVSVQLSTPAGFVPVSATNKAGQNLNIANGFLSAALLEKDSSTRTLVVVVRKADAVATGPESNGTSGFRISNTTAKVISYDKIDKDVAISKEWQNTEEPTEASKKAAEDAASINNRAVNEKLPYVGSGPNGSGEQLINDKLPISSLKVDPDPTHSTFLITYLGNPWDDGAVSDVDLMKKSDDYNERNNVDYYVTASRSMTPGDTKMYLNLVNRATDTIVETVVFELGGENPEINARKTFKTLDALVAPGASETQLTPVANNPEGHSVKNTYALNYFISVSESSGLNPAGQLVVKQNLNISGTVTQPFTIRRNAAGDHDPTNGTVQRFTRGQTSVGDNNEIVYVLQSMSSLREGNALNHVNMEIPQIVEQNNYFYRVNAQTYEAYLGNSQSYKEQVAGDEKLLSHLTTTGYEGQIFNLPAAVEYAKYELVETPFQNETEINRRLSQTYVKGTRFQTNNGNNGMKRIVEIDKETGEVHIEIWVLDISKEGWYENHFQRYATNDSPTSRYVLERDRINAIVDKAELEKTFTLVHSTKTIPIQDYANEGFQSFDFLEAGMIAPERRTSAAVTGANLAEIEAYVAQGTNSGSAGHANNRYGNTQYGSTPSPYGAFRVPILVATTNQNVPGMDRSSSPSLQTVQIGGTTHQLLNENDSNTTNLHFYYVEKGSVTTHYVDVDGKVIATPVLDTDHGDTKSAYDTTDSTNPSNVNTKPATIEFENATYFLVEANTPTMTDGTAIVNGVKQITKDGSEKVYDPATNMFVEQIDAEQGEVEAVTHKHLTYVYQKGGDVKVHYFAINEDGTRTPLSGTATGAAKATVGTTEEDTAYSKPGTGYNTSEDLKPTTITDDQGNVWTLVADETNGYNEKDGKSDEPSKTFPETGEVEAATTKHINYYYKKVAKTGDVIIHYVDLDGKPIAADKVDSDDKPVGDAYNTTEEGEKPAELTGTDGTKYFLTEKTEMSEAAGKTPIADGVKQTESTAGTGAETVKHTATTTGETAKVVEGTTHVTYVYEKGGDVKVHYFAINEDGTRTPLSGTATGAAKATVGTTEEDTAYSKPGTGYNTSEDLKPTTITDDQGNVWTLVADETNGYNEKDGKSDEPSKTFPETGEVEAATTKHINYYYKKVEEPVTPKTGNVVINYVDTEGNTLKSTVKDTTDGAINSDYDTKQDDNEYPEYITKEVEGVIKTYKRVPAGDYTVGTVGTAGELTSDNPADATVHGTDTPTGKVAEGTKTITYVYKEVTPNPVGNVVVRYHIVDAEGNVVKENAQTEVKDTVDAAADTAYNTTDYKPASIVVDGKTYDLVTPETSKHAVTDGDAEDGAVVANETKVVNYYYVERQPETQEAPKTGDVVVRYHIVDAEGNVIQRDAQTEVKDTVKANGGTSYTTTDYKPASIVVGNKTYDLVTPTTSKHAETDGELAPSDDTATHVPGTEAGDTVAAEKTKVVNYYYVERKEEPTPQPETPKTGDVVVRYHIVDAEGNVIQRDAQTEVKDTVKANEGTSYTTTDYKPASIVVGNKTYDLVTPTTSKHAVTDGVLSPSDDTATHVSGTETGDTVAAEKTKVVNYYYVERKEEPTPQPETPKTGDVVVRYHIVDAEGNVIQRDAQTEVKDTVKANEGTSYTTTDYKPASIVVGNKTYDLVTPSTSKHAVTDGVLSPSDDTATHVSGTETGDTVAAEKTKVVNYYYVERQPEAPKPTGNVVITYVDTNGKELKTEVKDTTNGEVGKTYDTKEGTTEYPTYITTEDGKTYKRVPAGDYPVGKTTEDGHLTTSDKPGGTVEEGTKTVTYVYEEVKPTTPETPETPKTGNVVITYVDTNGKELKTEVKDTTNGEVGKTYDTKEGNTEYPTYITTEDGKTYKRVPAGDYPVGKTTEDGHLTTSDKPSGTVEEGTKTVTYVYEEVVAPTPDPVGNVVVRYHIVDAEGNVVKENAQTEVKDTVDAAANTAYNTTDYKPASIVVDGKTYDLVTPSTSKHAVTDGDAEDGAVVANETKVVNYYYVERKEEPTPQPETPKTGDVVVRYHIVDAEGNVIQRDAQTEVKDTVKANEGTSYTTTDYKPASIVVGNKTYDLVTPSTSKHAVTDGVLSPSDDTATHVSGTETGDTVAAEKTKVVNYYYVERQPETQEAPKTGDVVVRYHIVDAEGNVIQRDAQTEVKDTVKANEGTSYTTTDYKPASIVVGNKTYDLVTPSTSKHAVTDGVLSPSDDTATHVSGTETGDTVAAEKTKVVNYYYVERQPETQEAPKTGDVVVRYHIVDAEGNVIQRDAQTEVKDTVKANEGTSYTTTDYKPASIVVGNKTYDLVTPSTSKHAVTDGVLSPSDDTATHVSGTETGDTVAAEKTKVVNYYYVERQPEAPKPTGNVVITYVDTNGKELKTEVKDTTNGEVGKTYDTKEGNTEYPTYITTEDGKTYKRVPAGDYPVGKTTEDGHLTTSDKPSGTVEEGTKTVTYVYEEVVAPTPDPVGNVVVRYHIVDAEGNVVKENAQTEVKDTVDAAANTAYNTTDYKPASIVVDGKTYDLVTPSTSKHAVTDGDAEDGAVVANETKVVNYYYVERQPEAPKPTGNVVITYVDTNGKELKTEVKDTTNGEVGKTYDTKEGNTEYPTYITTEDGKTYKRVPAGDYPVGKTTEDGHLTTSDKPGGTVEEGTKTVTYVYEEVLAPTPDPVGNVVVRYHIVDAEGNVVKENAQTEVKDTVDAAADTAYNTTDYKPASIVVDGKTYDLVTPETSKHAVTDGDAEDGAVVANETKVVNYYYVERQPETQEAPKTGNVVITYVDTNGKELKTEVKDTTNGEVGKTYDTKEGNTEYPTYITTENGKTYKRVPAGDYPVGKTTEDGHLTTSDKPSGTVEEGTKTVTYVYEEVKPTTPETPEIPKTGNVVITYVDTNGKELKTEVKDTTNGEVGKTYDTKEGTTEYPTYITTEDGKTYKRVPAGDYPVGKTTEDGHLTTSDKPSGTVEEGTKTVTYVYEEVKPTTPETPETPKTGNVVITYVDTNGKELKTEVKDTTNGEVGKTYDTKEGTTEYPTYITTEDGKTYKRVPAGDYPVGKTTEDGHLTTSDKPSGTVEEGTKTVTYVYEEVKPTTPETPETPKTGNVVITYVDTNGKELKTEVKDTTNGEVGKTYDTKEGNTEYPTYITTEDGKTYKRVPAGDYPVGKTTEDGHLTTSDKPSGTVEEGTKTVTYVYEEVKPTTPETPETPKTGNVVITYVDTNGKELKTEVKDTTNGEVGKTYDTKEGNTEYPTYITTEDGKTYKRVPAGDYPVGKTTEDGHLTTSDKPSGTVEEGTKTVTYVYEEVKPTTPETPETPKTGNVVITYVDTNGKELKTEVKDTTNGEVGKTYDTKEGNTEYPTYITTEDGKTYKRVPAGDYPVGKTTEDGHLTTSDKPSGTVEEGTKTVTYVYEEVKPTTPETPETPKTGNVVITYVDTNGKELKTEVKDTTNGEVGKTYDTKEGNTEYPTYITTEDGKTYKRVPAGDYPVGKTTEDGHLTTSDKPSGTVEEGTKTVTYVYEEVKPTTPETPETPKTGNVVITYVDTNGKELKTEVKDTTNGEVGKTYDTKEGNTEYPTYITTEDGKTYKRVPAGDYPVGKTTEDGHLTTSDKPSGTVEEGTKTVTYVYEEVKPTTPDPVIEQGNVEVHYHIVDKDGNVLTTDAIAPVVKSPSDADTPYSTRADKLSEITVGGKTYILVTEETSEHPVTDGDAEEGAIVANATKIVNYYYVEKVVPVVPSEETPSKPGSPDKEIPSKPVSPRPEAVVQPVEPVTPRPVTPATPAKATLPNTGDASSAASLLGAGILLTTASLFSRRRNED